MNDDVEKEAEALAWETVQIVTQIRDRILHLRRSMVEDSLPEDPRDATSFAGHLAAALIQAGGHLSDGNPHRLRFPIAESPPAVRDARAIGATRLLLLTIVDALGKGDTADGPDHILERVAAEWPKHRNKAAADHAFEAQRQLEAEAQRQQAIRDHEARLARAKAPAPKPPPRHDTDRPPPPAGERHFINPNEWVMGDDIGAGAPRVS